MKLCNKCNMTKPFSDFNKKGTGYQSKCRQCDNEYTKQHYKANKSKYLDRIAKNNKAVTKRNQDFICEYLSNHSCVDCGESDIIVLEFDHQRDKLKEVSILIKQAYSIDKLIEEINKCEVVCANCHKRRTAKSKNYFKYNYIYRNSLT